MNDNELKQEAVLTRNRLIDNILTDEQTKQLESKVLYLCEEQGMNKAEAKQMIEENLQPIKSNIFSDEEMNETKRTHFTNWKLNEDNIIWKNDEEIENDLKLKDIYKKEEKRE